MEGDDFRLLATPQRLIHAVRRIPARVFGDGQSTVEQLVKKTNDSPNRGPRFKQQLVTIKLDAESKYALHEQGLNTKSFPKPDQEVYLKTCCNQCKGGEVEAVTEKVNPEYAAIATAAAEALEVPLAGVDIMTKDITKPPHLAHGKIIEVNENPGLLIHKYPSAGKGIEVYKLVLRTLFQKKLV